MGKAQEGLCGSVARMLGARQAWVIPLSASQVLEQAIRPPDGSIVVRPLDGTPVTCTDLRALGAKARMRGVPLIVNASACGVTGCAANRLGAHVSLVGLEEGLCVVGLSRDGAELLPDVGPALDDRATSEAGVLQDAMRRIDALDLRWRASSDTAQVVAAYLRCHPRVAEVRYPGLRGDPSFEVAARTLSSGFGPVVDYRLEGQDVWVREACGTVAVRESILNLERRLAKPDRVGTGS